MLPIKAGFLKSNGKGLGQRNLNGQYLLSLLSLESICVVLFENISMLVGIGLGTCKHCYVY